MSKKTTILLFILIFLGCEKGDGFKEFGYEYIFMPQAMVTGGINNNYSIPSGGGEYTNNFIVNNDKVDVILGVLRSGSSKSAAYSVDILSYAPSSDVLESLNGVVLSSSMYTLPNYEDVSSDNGVDVSYVYIDYQTFFSVVLV